MPGTPDPVLGSTLSTAAVSALAGVVAVVLAVRFRDAASPRGVAVGGGGGYAVVAIGLWFAVRVVTNEFAHLSGSSLVLAGVALLTAAVIAVHTGLALYLHARWGLLTPLAVLFGATSLVAWLFLHVRGETDPVGLYAILFGPAVVAVLLALAGAEYGVRSVLAA